MLTNSWNSGQLFSVDGLSGNNHGLTLAHQRCSVVENRTRAPGTQARRRQPAEAQRPDVHRSCPVPSPHRDPLAGPARRVRQLECRLPSLSPLEKGGLWERLWHRFQNIDDDQLSELFIDSTVVRAHQHAAGASKKRWATSPGSGPLSGWVLHQAARGGLHGRAYRGVVRVDRWTAP